MRLIIKPAKKVRKGSMPLEEVTGDSFKITSIENIDGFAATSVVSFPEVALLGLMRTKLLSTVINQTRNSDLTNDDIFINYQSPCC